MRNPHVDKTQSAGSVEPLERKLFLDTHVHIRSCFPKERVLDVAFNNFASAANHSNTERWVGVLMLTESATENSFREIRELLEIPCVEKPIEHWGDWLGLLCQDERSVLLRRGSTPRENPYKSAASDPDLVLVSGRQIDTAERLEVSALGSDSFIPDGTPILEILDQAEKSGSFQIIPWAPGKWSFGRGQILSDLIADIDNRQIALGDNGGRPDTWPVPRHFREAKQAGLPILGGSDPLPFESEMFRIGTFGVELDAPINWLTPTDQILDQLRQLGTDVDSFGGLSNLSSFLRNEIVMQLTKKKRKRLSAQRRA